MTSRTIKDAAIVLDDIVWSDVSEYRLGDFVDQFTLPQVVKVLDGYHGTNEDSCISSGQILILHSVRTTEKALARDRENTELCIPLNVCEKVELCPADTATATRLKKGKFYRVTATATATCVPTACPGDKLEVVSVKRGTRGKDDCIQCRNQSGTGLVSLPFSATKDLQPLVDGRESFLKDLSVMKLPVYFQFIDPPNPMPGVHRAENVFNSSLGVLKLEQVYQDSSVICTTKDGYNRTVVTCPKTLPITVAVAQGALVGDKDYVRLCHLFHDGVSLSRIENMESENIYASPDSVREYQYVGVTERAPPVPPRTTAEAQKTAASSRVVVECSLSPATKEQVQDERKDSTEIIYEDPEALMDRARIPPPIWTASRPDARIKEEATDSSISGQMSQMSIKEVSNFLKSWHLGKFADVFSENDVDGEILVGMNAQELNDLGMNSFESKKLLMLISGWRPKTSGP